MNIQIYIDGVRVASHTSGFGGGRDAKKLLEALATRPMTRTEMHRFCKNNISGERLAEALDELQRQGLASAKSEKTGYGRTVVRWYATAESNTSCN